MLSPLRALLVSVVCGSAAVVLLPPPASACSNIAFDDSQAATRQRAKSNVERATAIVDGEVVRPFIRGQQTAVVRVHLQLKGPQVETLEVGERNSCDIALENVGVRMRMLLVGGPELYFLQVDQGLAEYEDAVLKSDRSRAWPYYKPVEAVSQ